MKLKDTNEMFTDDLRDPAYAAGYLNIALEEDGIEGFLYALQKVGRAHGISKVAASSDIPPESLYRALSEKGNPGIKPLARVLDSLGLCLTIKPSATERCATDEISSVQDRLEERIATMCEDTRREHLETRRATLEIQEETRRILAQVQQLATAVADRTRQETI